MNIYYFAILVVLIATTRTYKMKKIRNINIKTKEKCENIKCPPIDDPVCVKMKKKNMKEIYVIAINKCEIKYANCHKDLEAVIVPMQNCVHEIKSHQNTTGKRNKREIDDNSKDSIKDREDDKGGTDIDNNVALTDENNDIENEDDNESGIALNDENEDSENEDDKGRVDDDNEDSVALNDENEDNENEDDKGRVDDDNESNVALNGENEDTEGDKGRGDDDNEGNVALNDENTDIKNEDYDLLKGESEENKVGSKENVKTINAVNDNRSDGANDDGSDNHKEKVLNDEDNTESENENIIQNLTAVDNVGADYDQHDEEVDLDESKKKCPTVCPSRDVMVCAKCRHNIHRTFLSQCHLRMFACKHTKEKLRLVKREPCVQSAPFITNFNETKGRLPESGEPDEVHKFIFCRNKKLLNEDDPRCKFAEKDK